MGIHIANGVPTCRSPWRWLFAVGLDTMQASGMPEQLRQGAFPPRGEEPSPVVAASAALDQSWEPHSTLPVAKLPHAYARLTKLKLSGREREEGKREGGGLAFFSLVSMPRCCCGGLTRLRWDAASAGDSHRDGRLCAGPGGL
jgi:hypothetical protein